jgi:hypothetical protein
MIQFNKKLSNVEEIEKDDMIKNKDQKITIVKSVSLNDIIKNVNDNLVFTNFSINLIYSIQKYFNFMEILDPFENDIFFYFSNLFFIYVFISFNN